MDETFAYVITHEAGHLEQYNAHKQEVQGLLDEYSQAHGQDLKNNSEKMQTFLSLQYTMKAQMSLTNNLQKRIQRGEMVYLSSTSRQISSMQERMHTKIEEAGALIDAEAEDATKTLDSDPRTLIYVSTACIILTVLALFFIVLRTVIRPLHTLRDAALVVASGDLNHQVQITSRDELGDLGRAFNTMIARVANQQHELQAEVSRANAARADAEAARSEIAAQLQTIEEQRAVIRDMSVPVLPLSDKVMVMPLVGALDTARLMHVQEQALHALESSSARHLILDITGVPVVDTQVAHGLMQVIQSARLLGSEVLLVGIRPEVAQSIVGLGIQLEHITTHSSLQNGMAQVFARKN
ncbi:MAG TPA: STAS domain-containing protein [Roseiflexaceae bacterium]|nr:STAS domain-containing protein [Roseiflexaceae bacterium]